MSHPFERYFRKHGHALTLRFDNGVQRMSVSFHPGYVQIRTSSPFAGEVFITRTAFFNFLRGITPVARLWRKHPAQDWDVPASVHAAYLMEQDFDAAQREEKRSRQSTLEDAEKRERQRKRWLAARARASSKHP